MINTFYRPAWTCGRFNSRSNVAIFYNLMEGMSYFFEEDSAVIIGLILSVPRNGKIDIHRIAKESDTDIECLNSFLLELEERGLVISFIPNETFISHYRSIVREQKKLQAKQDHIEFLDQTIIGDISSAEREYMDRTGGITSVMFELTYNCSEKCIHCYNPGATRNDAEKSYRANRTELDLVDYKHLIDELETQGVMKVCLSGGDPFSKPIIWDILDYLYEKGLAIDIFTNGQRVYKEVKRLANYYPRLIGVSLYSNIKSDHEYITRIPNSYDNTIEFIRECYQFGLSMNIKCCIMKPNLKSYYTVKKVAEEYGAIAQFDLNITDSVDGDICASKYLRLTPDLMEIVLRDKDLPYYISSKKLSVTEEPLIKIEGKMCNAGISSLCITPEGNIQPCCAFPMKIGNIKEDSLSNLLEKSSLLNWWKKQEVKDCTDCHKHPYCVYCQMCPGNNYISNGSPLVPSKNNCEIAITRYNLAKKMENSEYDPLSGQSLEQRLSQIEISPINLERLYSNNYRDNNRINGVS